VQRGETKASVEHEAIRRGGRAYLQQRAKRMLQREAAAVAKAAAEDE